MNANATTMEIDCPHCGQRISVGITTGVYVCPHCSQNIEITDDEDPSALAMVPAIRNPPPVPKLPKPLDPGIFYQDPQILISKNVLQLGPTTYAIANITSVFCEEKRTQPENALAHFILFLAISAVCGGLIPIYHSGSSNITTRQYAYAIAGFTVGAILGYLATRIKPPRAFSDYIIWLDTNSGRKRGISFRDEVRATNVILAIRAAIAS